MKYTDLDTEEFFELLSIAWRLFSVAAVSSRTEVVPAIVFGLDPKNATIALYPPRPGESPKELFGHLRQVPAIVSLLLSETWMVSRESRKGSLEETIRSVKKTLRELPDHFTALVGILSFEDGQVIFTGRLSADEPTPGEERSISIDCRGVSLVSVSL